MTLKYLALAIPLMMTASMAMEKPGGFDFHPSPYQSENSDIKSLENGLSGLTFGQPSIHDADIDNLAHSLTNLTTSTRFSVKFWQNSTFSQEIRDVIPGVLRAHGLGDLLEEIHQIAPYMHLELNVRLVPSTVLTPKFVGKKRRADFDQVGSSLKKMRLDDTQDESISDESEEEIDSKPYFSNFTGRLMTDEYLYQNLYQNQKKKLQMILHGPQARRITTAVANLYPKEYHARVYLYLVR